MIGVCVVCGEAMDVDGCVCGNGCRNGEDKKNVCGVCGREGRGKG